MSTERTETRPQRLYEEESQLRLKGRKVADRWAKWVVSAGGFAIIASILAILFFIIIEIIPLFRPAEIRLSSSVDSKSLLSDKDAKPIAVGLDENQEVGYFISNRGEVRFFDVANSNPRESDFIEQVAGQEISSAWQSLDGRSILLGTNQGDALQVRIDFNSKYFDRTRTYNPTARVDAVFNVDKKKQPLMDIAYAGDLDESIAIAGVTEDGRIVIFLREKAESLFGDTEVDSSRYELDKIWSGQPLSIALDSGMRNLYAGTDLGKIYHWTLSFDEAPRFVSVARASQDAAIAEMHFLIGGRTLMVGDARGKVSAWFPVRDSTSVSGWRLTRIRDMQAHTAPVTALSPSARRKGFISGDEQGNLLLQYTTSERSLAAFSVDNAGRIDLIKFAPKANGVLTLDSSGKLTHWRIDNPHPEAGLKAFFGKVWYEGYEKPEYVWQSTGGTDDFEPKLSLVPLIFGSLKGTLYALIIAIPLAIFGAIFTSQFMHPSFRNIIKPMVEIMAALPSIVLGFLAGLWLAPRIEGVIPAILTMAVLLPAIVLLSSAIWKWLPKKVTGRFRPGIESLILVPVVLVGIWLCLALSGWSESFFFAGDFKRWLYENLSLNYDQRNALVVGIAMGFAVIPIIYTISEDALSNVPQNLISGSLAMGATRWQTALRVAVPTAAAGIFSAIMIGLGRAVGETMIVLMATGNTPIMDWNIFNGFRTLSANIAVEIPEAPVGGTLYRTLFLAAMLLFIITFVINTLAEIIRQRLREKYQKL